MAAEGPAEGLPTIQILGLSFTTASCGVIIKHLARGGYLVAPAAPALVDLQDHPAYRQALEQADAVITDSGFMILCWNLCHRGTLRRTSGLKLLTHWIKQLKPEDAASTFWIHPDAATEQAHRTWLEQHHLHTTDAQHYLAPMYDPDDLSDPELLRCLEEQQPAWIVINLGGGTQEILGQYLNQRLSTPAGILCTGAAMAFLSGAQVHIPLWSDRLMLGWLFRCFSNPGRFIPRYLKALKLAGLLLRYGPRSPA